MIHFRRYTSDHTTLHLCSHLAFHQYLKLYRILEGEPFGSWEPPGLWGPAGGGSDSGLSHVFCSFSATTEPIPKLFFSYESIFVEDFDSLGGHTKFFASEAPREA